MLLAWAGLLILVIAAIPYFTYVALYYWCSPRGSPARKVHETPSVSILIPTHNEEAIVEDTLERLCDLEYPSERIEVVVVDSSDDRTAEIAREFFSNRNHPSLNLVEEDDRGGVARAVNRGVAAASHPLIFRTDCDARLQTDALSHAVANLQDQRIGAVTGRQVEVIGESKLEESYRGMQARNQALESHLDSTFIVHGPCFAFRTEQFSELSEDTVADDTEIAVRIRKAGSRVVMDPEMLFAETGTSDIRRRRMRKDRRAMGLLQILLRHRDLLGKFGLYGRFVVPFNWWFLAISPWLTFVGGGLFLLGVTVLAPPVGIALLGGVVLGVVLGSRDRLGPFQFLYVILDSHLSLVIASIGLLRGDSSNVWAMDRESRDAMIDR